MDERKSENEKRYNTRTHCVSLEEANDPIWLLILLLFLVHARGVIVRYLIFVSV